MMISRSKLVRAHAPQERPNADKVLLIDADSYVYRASAKAKTVPAALRTIANALEAERISVGCDKAIAFFTSSDCTKNGRGLIKAHKPYQGDRAEFAQAELLHAVRDAVLYNAPCFENLIDIVVSQDIEADDALVIAQNLRPGSIILSNDKDLQMCQGALWDIPSASVLTELGVWQNVRSKRVHGHGHSWFWMQMLMGDQCDNVQGLRSFYGTAMGKGTAFNAYWSVRNIADDSGIAFVDAVLDAYRNIEQNFIPEGFLLWLLRAEDDSFLTYMEELLNGLTRTNQAYYWDCKAEFLRKHEHLGNSFTRGIARHME